MYKLYKNKKKYKFKESFDFFSYPLILNNVEVSIVDERIIKIFIKSNINFDFSKLASKVIIFLDNDFGADDIGKTVEFEYGFNYYGRPEITRISVK